MRKKKPSQYVVAELANLVCDIAAREGHGNASRVVRRLIAEEAKKRFPAKLRAVEAKHGIDFVWGES